MIGDTEKTTRNSSFELLRIISMFMIVVWHVGTHGITNYVELPKFLFGYTEILYYFIRSLSVVAVSIYVIISGYFLSKSKFKISRLIKFFLEISFFSTLIYLVSVFMGYANFNIWSLLNTFLSVFTNEYWFVTVYFTMYALSPFLNQLINNMSKEMHLNLLKVLFLFFCVWQFIEKIEVIGVQGGFGLIYFLFLYFLGGYINNYKFIIKNISAKSYMLLYIVFAIINTGIYVYGTKYNTDFFLFKHITRLYSYNSPVVLLMSYFLFQSFRNINFKSSSINSVAKYVFGIYLIHDNPFVRGILWNNFGIVEDIISSNQYLFLLNILKYSLLIFIVCLILSIVIGKTYNAFYENIYKIIYKTRNIASSRSINKEKL